MLSSRQPDRCGLCDVSVRDLCCLYAKDVPEEDKKSGVLEILGPDARGVYERF